MARIEDRDRKPELSRSNWLTAGQSVALSLPAIRAERGFTQDKLAQKLTSLHYPMARVTLAKIELGDQRARNIGLEETLALAVALDTSVSDLVIPAEKRLQLVPMRSDENAMVSPITVSPADARAWFAHRKMAPGQDPDFFYSRLTTEERALVWRLGLEELQRREQTEHVPIYELTEGDQS